MEGAIQCTQLDHVFSDPASAHVRAPAPAHEAKQQKVSTTFESSKVSIDELKDRLTKLQGMKKAAASQGLGAGRSGTLLNSNNNDDDDHDDDDRDDDDDDDDDEREHPSIKRWRSRAEISQETGRQVERERERERS
eukprot:9003650-Pyramimonas_sp.AAC.1